MSDLTDVNSPHLDNPAIVPDSPSNAPYTRLSLSETINWRRAVTSGLIAGAVIIFLILIGIPGGTGANNSLPPWFAWGMFALTAGLFAYFAARPRNPVEKRTTGALAILVRGMVIGVIAAALTVTLACAINAGQRWQIAGPPGQLADGLSNNIQGVQDVFNSVTERTTAVLSGLSEAQLNPSLLNGVPRADPTGGFFLLACLLPLAGIIGSGAALPAILREEESAEKAIAARTARNPAGRWLGLIVPIVVLILIILNETLSAPDNPGAAQYNQIVGGNAQLIGLLATFVLVTTALLAVRESNVSRVSTADGSLAANANNPSLKIGLGLLLTLIFFVVGFVAPSRNPTDLLLSPKTPGVTQVVGADGQPAIMQETVASITNQALFDDRRVIIVIVGVLFAIVNVLAARDRRLTLRRLLALDILFASLAILPLYLDKYQQSVLLLVGINVLLGLGLNIVVGYAGLLDLGYVAFFAIGAYAYAFLSSNEQANGGLKFNGNHAFATNLAFSIVVGGLVAAAVIGLGVWWWRQTRPAPVTIAATPVGSRVSRQTATTSGDRPVWLSYVLVIGAVAIASAVIALLRDTPFYASFGGFPVFVLGILVGVLAAAGSGVLLGIPVLRLRGDYLAIVTLGFGEIIRLVLNNLKGITGGPQGLLTIPPAAVGNIEISSNEGLLYLTIIGCLLVAVFSLRLKSSRIGRAWGALSSDEDIAQAMGINITSTKVLAFAFGAAFAGIGGVIFAARQGSIFPENFTLDQSINVLSLVIIGGMGSIPGVIVGALVLVGVPESLRVFSSYRILAFGALLIAMTILRPRGLLPQPPTPLEDRAAELAARDKAIPRAPLPVGTD